MMLISCTVALMRSASLRLVRSLNTFIKGAAMVDLVLVNAASKNSQLANKTRVCEGAVDCTPESSSKSRHFMISRSLEPADAAIEQGTRVCLESKQACNSKKPLWKGPIKSEALRMERLKQAWRRMGREV